MSNDDRYSHEATELQLYIENTQVAYNAYFLPAAKRVQHFKDKGTFNYDQGLKLMAYCVNAAAKQYNLEHGSMSSKWSDLFPKGDRDRVAEYLLDTILAELRIGNRYES